MQGLKLMIGQGHNTIRLHHGVRPQFSADVDDWHMQADASMRVHMLERELARAQKDIVALRCQLRCQPGSVANPAVLRAAAAVSSALPLAMLAKP